MWKSIGLASTVMVLFLFPNHKDDRFSNYRAVETYEIRPGILMMPRYSDDGQLCEIAIERQHYWNGTAILAATIPNQVLTQIVDELVPVGERGPVIPTFGRESISLFAGKGYTTVARYKEISINISGIAPPRENAGDIVAVISWNNRKCYRDAD